MRRQSNIVRWSLLYLIFPLACILLWLEHQAPVPPAWHGFLLFAVMGVTYGLIALWCGSNSCALERNDVRVRPIARAEVGGDRQAALEQHAVATLPERAATLTESRELTMSPVWQMAASNAILNQSSCVERDGHHGR